MTSPYECRHCGSLIDLADTNVSTDVALCRRCGRTMPFSALAAATGDREADLASPPRGVRVGRSLIDGIDITCRKFNPVVLFLIPFTAVWSGFSMWAIYGRQVTDGKFSLAMSLFGLPFLFGTIALVSFIAFQMFGSTRIRIGRGTCEAFIGIGPLGWRRSIRIHPASKVRIETGHVTVNRVRQKHIVITTDGEAMKFGTLLAPEARDFIAAVLQRAVAAQ